MTMITPSYLGETIEYSSLHACRSTLEDPTDDEMSGWHPDPFGRFDERYFIDDEPSQLVRTSGIESQDSFARVTPNASAERLAHETPARREQRGVRSSESPGRLRPRGETYLTARFYGLALATVGCAVGAVIFFTLHVSATVRSVNGLRTVSYDCGSVKSPKDAPSDGVGFLNQGSECSKARHSNQLKAIFFGCVALVGVIRAGFESRWTYEAGTRHRVRLR